MISKQVSSVELVVAFIWEVRKKTKILFEAHPLFSFSLFQYVLFSIPVHGKRCIPSSKTSSSSGKPAHPLSTWVTGPLSPGLKRPGREAVLSSPCNS
jgi:hypothetical protein